MYLAQLPCCAAPYCCMAALWRGVQCCAVVALLLKQRLEAWWWQARLFADFGETELGGGLWGWWCRESFITCPEP
jgi:hypothetical protein